MKYHSHLGLVSVVSVLTVLVAGCEVIGGIFKAGVWVGILIVLFILAVIIIGASWFNKK